MKKSVLLILPVLILLLSAAAPVIADGMPIKVASGFRAGIEIPAFVTVPADADASAPVNLVILIHGHGDDHNEFGGFDAISDSLSENGILAVTLDLPGCGASTESFRLNTLTNMKHDVLDVLHNLERKYRIAKVGVFGYSMGGRVALELIAEDLYAFDAAVFIAPAEDNTDIKAFFGGEESWERIRAEAEKNGFSAYPTVFGTYELSMAWADDFDRYPDGLAEAAAEQFDGKPAIVIYSPDDPSISPAVSQGVADAFGAAVYHTHADGHSYGFFGDAPEVAEFIRDTAVTFFLRSF